MARKPSTFGIRYTGDIRPETLTAAELIGVLSAFNSISLKASRAIYGSDTQFAFRLSHVQPGSIDIQGILELIAGLQPAFGMMAAATFDLRDIPALIKAWLDLAKFLKGAPAGRIQTVSNGNAIQIENSAGNTTVINGNVYNTFISADVGRDTGRLNTPTRHGATRLELLRGRKRISAYSAEELEAFQTIKPTDKPIESEIDAYLSVVAPVLEGDGVWRFKYGRSKLTAKLEDDLFREKVHEGTESFRHGDSLRVRLKTIQERVGSKVSTKHYVTKVLGRR